jgi:hypothetical protein
MQTDRPKVLAIVALSLAAVGAPCPWWRIPFSSAFGDVFGTDFFGGGGGVHMSVTVNAFNGHVTALGVEVPNWLLVGATLAAAALALLRVRGTVDAPKQPVIGLFAGSTLGLLFGLAAVLSNDGTSIGIGSLLVLAANRVGIWGAGLLQEGSVDPRSAA